jgi:hypothetical protein
VEKLQQLPKFGEFEAFCELSGETDFFCWKDVPFHSYSFLNATVDVHVHLLAYCLRRFFGLCEGNLAEVSLPSHSDFRA